MFRFRLQQVLNLREQRQTEIATQLARALSVEQDAKEQLDDLQTTRLASAALAAENGQGRSIGELTNLAFIMEQLDEQIATATDAVYAASEAVTNVKNALTVAFQNRRVLDRLRERHEEDYRASEEQQDRRTMDDIALSRYALGDAE
jgi:flagellar FliJ protein